jgi:prolyl 4-hydroxylase
VRVVRARITELIGVPDRRINELQVVRYDPGQQFTPHFDSSFQFWSLPTPRQLREFSIFVYLNTMPANAGGETEFTKIGVKFTPKAGDALFWRNHKDRHSEHFSDGAHAGRPPTSGVKYGQSTEFNLAAAPTRRGHLFVADFA